MNFDITINTKNSEKQINVVDLPIEEAFDVAKEECPDWTSMVIVVCNEKQSLDLKVVK